MTSSLCIPLRIMVYDQLRCLSALELAFISPQQQIK